MVEWKIDRHLAFTADYAHFFAEDFPETNHAGPRRALLFVESSPRLPSVEASFIWKQGHAGSINFHKGEKNGRSGTG